MPKELSHWFFAELTSQLIEPGKIKESIRSHAQYFFLGAVAYDCPFYAFFVDNADELTEAALRLHGVSGEDTFEPFRQFIGSYAGGEVPLETLSFISGAITHLCGDINFHPLVNYFSGEYDAGDSKTRHSAQMRHRQFESRMDLHFGKTMIASGFHLAKGLKKVGALSKIVEKIKNERSRIEDVMERFYFGIPRNGTAGVWGLLNRHAQIQGLFAKKLLGLFVGLLGAVAKGGIAVTAATFYPARRFAESELFTNPIKYRNPNTGEKLLYAVDNLAKKTAEEAASLINSLQQALESGTGRDWLRGKRGRSLKYGCDAEKFPDSVYLDVSTPVPALCRRGQRRGQ